MTSTEAQTYDEVALILAEVLERTIRYPHPNVTWFRERMHERHQPVAYVLVTTVLYAVAALGKAGHLSDDTRQLLASDPITFRHFSRDFAGVWATMLVGVSS